MSFIDELLQYTLDPEKLILFGGITVILLVIFAENGIFFCFFFPGDTLLFTTGILCSTGVLKTNIFLLASSVWVAAIIGNLTGYAFGRKVGQTLFNRKESILFKKKYVETAQIFFKKYGGMALIMGRFLPIIRTFAPIFAGIVKFDIVKLLIYNTVGGFLWVFSMIFAGYFTANLFPQIQDNLEIFVICIIIITWIPVVRTYLKERKKEKKPSENQNE